MQLMFGAGDTRLFATLGDGSDARGVLWSVPDGDEITSIPGAWELHGDYVFGGPPGTTGDCHVWRASDGGEWLTINYEFCAPSGDGTLVVAHVEGGYGRWSVVEREPLDGVFEVPYSMYQSEVRGHYMEIQGWLDEVAHDATRIWDLATNQVVALFPADYDNVKFGAGDTVVFAWSPDGSTVEYELATGAWFELPDIKAYRILARRGDTRLLWTKKGVHYWTATPGDSPDSGLD